MKITAIQTQKRHPERVNVFVDGEFRLALAAEIASGAPLRVGAEITERQIRELERKDLSWKALAAALNLLSYRARAGNELRQRLQEKGFDEEITEACLAELRERGLIDDAAFAETFVRDRIRLRPKGQRRIVQELRAKGVNGDAARAAVERVWDEEAVSDLDLARDAARKWSPRPGEDPQRARRRLYGYLARRGFGTNVIRQVAGEVLKNAE